MRFDRLYETLQVIEKQEGITIEDALDLFYDFYEDVKTVTGGVLEQQPIGDRDRMIGRLCWLARMTARLYSRNEEALLAPEYEARWEKAGAKLAEAEAALSKTEKEAAGWQAQEERLEELLSEAQRRQAESVSAEQLCKEKEECLLRLEELAKDTARLREEAEELAVREAEAALVKERLQEKSDRLRACVAAWRGDTVLKSWPCDREWLDSLRQELEKAENEAESALEAYRERYCELVSCLEKGGKER